MPSSQQKTGAQTQSCQEEVEIWTELIISHLKWCPTVYSLPFRCDPNVFPNRWKTFPWLSVNGHFLTDTIQGQSHSENVRIRRLTFVKHHFNLWGQLNPGLSSWRNPFRWCQPVLHIKGTYLKAKSYRYKWLRSLRLFVWALLFYFKHLTFNHHTCGQTWKIPVKYILCHRSHCSLLLSYLSSNIAIKKCFRLIQSVMHFFRHQHRTQVTNKLMLAHAQ